MKRCPWCEVDDLYRSYHDEEWGVPSHDDRHHFEHLTLEGAQAGLSWHTVLRKRDAYRRAYKGFEPRKVARFNSRSVERLMGDAGIIRNRQKIESSVNNARRFLEVQEEFGSFAEYLWGFVGGKTVKNKWKRMSQIPANTPLSEKVSKDLKARGFRFVGPTTIYAHMQALGLVNDHVVGCYRYGQV